MRVMLWFIVYKTYSVVSVDGRMMCCDRCWRSVGCSWRVWRWDQSTYWRWRPRETSGAGATTRTISWAWGTCQLCAPHSSSPCWPTRVSNRWETEQAEYKLSLGVSFCLVWQTVINRVFRLESAMLVLKINKLCVITNQFCSQILLRISPNLVEPLPVNLESTVSLGGFPIWQFLIALSVLTIWRKITFRYFKKSATSNKSEWRNSI